MVKIRHTLQLFILTLFIVSCSPFRVVSDYDKNVDFSQYKSYQISNLGELNLNDIDQSRVLGELNRQLALKNIHSSDTPDLKIEIKASHKIVRDNYITPSINFGSWGSWFGSRPAICSSCVSQVRVRMLNRPSESAAAVDEAHCPVRLNTR